LDGSFSGVIPPAVSREAVEHFCRHEWARHLDDVMIRGQAGGLSSGSFEYAADVAE